MFVGFSSVAQLGCGDDADSGGGGEGGGSSGGTTPSTSSGGGSTVGTESTSSTAETTPADTSAATTEDSGSSDTTAQTDGPSTGDDESTTGTGGGPGGASHELCGDVFVEGSTSCDVADPIAGQLPNGRWVGRSLVTDVDGTRGCADVEIEIIDDEVFIETIFSGLQSTTYSRWVFSDDTTASIEDGSATVVGTCTCTDTTCGCEYTEFLQGTADWEFRQDVLLLDEAYSLDGSSSLAQSVAQAVCDRPL